MNTDPSHEHVGVEVLDGGIAVVTLKKPPANAVDVDFVVQMGDRVEEVAGKEDVKALVLTAEGKAFCAGVDLKAVVEYGRADQQTMVSGINRTLSLLYGFPVPTVAAVTGHAIAGGLVIALSCDYRIGPEGIGLFGLPEVKAAVPFPFAGIEVARAELSPRATRTLVLFGDNVGPDEALANGIFDELVAPDQVRARGIARARELAAFPPDAYNTIKRKLRGPVIDRMAKVIADGSDPALKRLITAEPQTAARALLEKRS